MTRHWSDGYIGIPARAKGRDRGGVDCWGLARLVFAAERGIVLPSYVEDYASIEEVAEIDGLISGAASGGVWHEVAMARAFDLAVFRRGAYASHIGIVVNPGLMLHVQADDQAKLEHYNSGRWQHRLTGIYRHVELASKVVR